ncbi:MAG TPA: helix-turn-helix transcriptional regulator [Casimicrobiaceae bacterium]
MSPRQAKALGKFLKERRTALGLSTRALASRSGVDMATIVRLEQGAFAEPRPDKLRAVAQALGTDVADVFAMADYTVPTELLVPYLHSKHRDLPPEAISKLERYAEKLARRYGIDPAGPAPGEDEAPPTRRRKR